MVGKSELRFEHEAWIAGRLDHPKLAVMGDTRYDQVNIRAADARSRHLLPESITAGKTVFIIGQSWPEDEEVILPALLPALLTLFLMGFLDTLGTLLTVGAAAALPTTTMLLMKLFSPHCR